MSAAEYYDPNYNFDSPQSLWGEPSDNEPTPTPVSGEPSNPNPNPTPVSGEPSNKKPSNKKSNPTPVSGEPSNKNSDLTAPADELKPFPWPKNYQNGHEFKPKDINTNYVRHRVFVPGRQSAMLPNGSNFLVQDMERKTFPMMGGDFSMYLEAKQESRKPISNRVPNENTELWVIFYQKRKEGTHLEPWQVKWRRA